MGIRRQALLLEQQVKNYMEVDYTRQKMYELMQRLADKADFNENMEEIFSGMLAISSSNKRVNYES